MNLKISIICFLLVLKLKICSIIQKNKEDFSEKKLEDKKIYFLYDLKTFDESDTQINLEVKMKNLEFKEESISFFFAEDECQDNLEFATGKTKEETSSKRTYSNSEIMAFYYNIEKKINCKCLIIIIENNLEGIVTIVNNQKYNPTKINKYNLNSEIKIPPTNEPIYLLFPKTNDNYLEITFPKEENIAKEIVNFKNADLEENHIENIPIDSKFTDLNNWSFKYSILETSYYYFYSKLYSKCFGLEIPKLSKEIIIKLSDKQYFNTDTDSYNYRKKFDVINPINRIYFYVKERKSPLYIEITTDKNNTELYYKFSNEPGFKEENIIFIDYVQINNFKIKQRENEQNKTEYRLYYEINKNENNSYINLFTKTAGLNSLEVRTINEDASDFPIIQFNQIFIVTLKKNKNTLVLFNIKNNHKESYIYYKLKYNINDFDSQSNNNIYINSAKQEPNEFFEFSDTPSSTMKSDFSITFENDTKICYIKQYAGDNFAHALYINPGKNSDTEKQIEFYTTEIIEWKNYPSATFKSNLTEKLFKLDYFTSITLPEKEIYYIQIELPSQFKVIHTYHKYINTKYKSCGAYKPKTTNDNTIIFYFGPINKNNSQTSADFLLDVLTTNITEDTKFRFLVTDVDESPNDIEPVDPLNPNPNPKPQPSDGGGGSTDKPKTNYILIIILLVLVIVIVAFIVLFCCFRETFSKICPFLKQVNSDSIINSVKSIDENNTP